jgi:hypothetical protein
MGHALVYPIDQPGLPDPDGRGPAMDRKSATHLPLRIGKDRKLQAMTANKLVGGRFVLAVGDHDDRWSARSRALMYFLQAEEFLDAWR